MSSVLLGRTGESVLVSIPGKFLQVMTRIHASHADDVHAVGPNADIAEFLDKLQTSPEGRHFLAIIVPFSQKITATHYRSKS